MQASDIKWLHVELSSRCNAWCPACPRNNHGYGLAPGIIEQDLSISRFVEVLDQLPNLYAVQMSGNYGDPLISKNIIEIIKISKIKAKKIQIHTNGSLRNKLWWRELANLLKDIDHDVWFGIDGIEEIHEIYRQGTNYKKIIENATSFINNGGIATWQFIPYLHNEHQIKDCLKLSQKLGFKKFKIAHLSRNRLLAKHYRTGQEFTLSKPTKVLPIVKHRGNLRNLTSALPKDCMHLSQPSVYLSAAGQLSRCCFLHNAEIFDSVNETIYNDVNLSNTVCINECAY